ncbi:phage major capsid protein [Xanthomonas sp. GPE 39]|uniref:phage major capsid protein n=1 Tax=Xanthomonas sp. GPE 39 TaxID=1583099 RepID=UPI0005F2EC0B|nr:phage major capsid protein [Xanthomonas sp. GPE 39]
MSKHLRELQAKKAKLVKEARALTEGAAAENRDLTVEEVSHFDALRAQIETASAAIDREMSLVADEARSASVAVALASSAAASPSPAAVSMPAGASIISVSDNRELDPRRGFASVGEFLKSVRQAESARRSGGMVDERLLVGSGIGAVAPGLAANESAGVDGGFAIPPQFSQDIFTLSLGEDGLLPMTDNVEISGNSIAFPRDETTPWGSNGVRAYWQGEASVAQATKPQLGLTTLRLKKLMTLVPITSELLEDTNALTSYLPQQIAERIRWKTNEAILNGQGDGVPLGAFQSGAVITVPKDQNQASQTLSLENLLNMQSRFMPGSENRGVWIINKSVQAKLYGITWNGMPAFMPIGYQINLGGSLTQVQRNTLLGMPVIFSQHPAPLSSQGDVLLVDLRYYQTITKAGGLQSATSMHLYFDADAVAFRTTFRMDGQSKIAQAVAPAKGVATLSPFVQLGAR